MSDTPMRRHPDNDLPDDHRAGDFAWYTEGSGPLSRCAERRILFSCPRRPGTGVCGVPIAPAKLPNGATWHWDGNEDAPTLSPSINCVGGCGWHGWVQRGAITGA